MMTLSEACESGNFDRVKYLVENTINYNINIDNTIGISIKNGHNEIVKYLVSKSDREMLEKNTNLFVMFSLQLGNLELFQYFNDCGLLISVQDQLKYACCFPERTPLKYIIELNTDAYDIIINNHDYIMNDILDKANIDLLQYLTDIGVKFSEEDFAYVCNNRGLDVINFFVQNGSKFNTLSLDIALRKGNYDFIKLVISHGVDTSQLNLKSYFHKLTHDQRFDFAIFLLKTGNHENISNDILVCALNINNIDLIKLFPLTKILEVLNIYAATTFKGLNDISIEIWNFLIEKGIDNETKKMFIKHIIRHQNTDSVQLLSDGLDPDQVIELLSYNGINYSNGLVLLRYISRFNIDNLWQRVPFGIFLDHISSMTLEELTFVMEIGKKYYVMDEICLLWKTKWLNGSYISKLGSVITKNNKSNDNYNNYIYLIDYYICMYKSNKKLLSMLPSDLILDQIINTILPNFSFKNLYMHCYSVPLLTCLIKHNIKIDMEEYEINDEIKNIIEHHKSRCSVVKKAHVE